MNGDYWMGVIIGYCAGTAITFLMIYLGWNLREVTEQDG